MLRLRPLAAVLGLCTACAQIIGLSDYEKVDGAGAGGFSGATGLGGSGGKAGKGGASSSEGGEFPGGAPGTGGTTGKGGSGGRGGTTGLGGVDAGGEAGVPGTGGALPGSGGRIGAGGTPPGSGGVPPTSGGAAPRGGAPATGGAGPGCQTVDLLADNGNFDGAAIPIGVSSGTGLTWYQGSVEGAAVVESTATLATYGVTPQSGARAAHLGEIGDHTYSSGFVGRDSWIGKNVTIPATATAVRLSCYVRVDSAELSTTENYDYLDLWLWDDALEEAAYVFDEFTNLDSPLGWYLSDVLVEPNLVPGLAGRTLSAEIYSLVDSTERTGFFVDTCSLRVTYCN
ncbi:MAG: hypothetical protein ACOY0T_16215 [Myxococcota bacterium]